MDPFSIPDKYNFHGDHELPWGPFLESPDN